MRDFSVDHSSLALNTATLGHNVEGHGAGWRAEQIIEACAARGYGAITYWRREIGNRAVEIGDRTRAAGLAVSGLCRSPFLVGPLAPPTREAVIDDFRASIEMASDLGASCLTICVGGVVQDTHSMTESLKQVRDIVAEVADEAAKGNVKLALEPLHPAYGGNRSCLVTVRDAINLCNEIGHPALSVAIDVYHVWWDLTLGQELLRLGGDRIAGYHLCDWLADTQDLLLDRGMMGDGVADLKTIRRALEATGYSGYCEIEIFSSKNWWKRDPEDVLNVCLDRYRTVC